MTDDRNFSRHLCAAGHLAMYEPDDTMPNACIVCGEAFRWHEDVTFGGDDVAMATPLRLWRPARHETCDHCGLARWVEPPRYRIPADDAKRVPWSELVKAGAAYGPLALEA